MSNKKVLLVFFVLLLALATVAPFIRAQDDMTDIYGRPLPEDAAPYSMQIVRGMCSTANTAITFSAIVSVYQRICNADQFSDSLVDLDNNLVLIPGAAESWEPSEDGLTWTFHLRPGQVWSDGTPLTAYDYEASYRFMADPANGYDFVWLWIGVIENWAEANAGEVPVEEIGYKAVDDLTIAVTTAVPFPPLPNTLVFWPPMQKKALEELGPNYIVDPATSVSSGPFMLTEYTPGASLQLVANPTYNGYRKPIIKELVGFFGDAANQFGAYQSHDIDSVSYEALTTADRELIYSDPVLGANYLQSPGDFRTDYLLMDTYSPPFDDQKVRLAFAKAVDRENIVRNVIGERDALPAYSFLMPGFPTSDTTGALRDIQAFDCPAAQSLLAEAGYPNGEGFPAVTLQLRGEGDVVRPRFDATAASISECLNITVEVNNMEGGAYMEALLTRPTTLQFGAVSYGMDYLDPANMLGLWVSTGRHSWRNAEFDALVTEANSLVGDPERRTSLYQQAERILVEDVGGIFLNHRIQGTLFQPYYVGGFREPNAQGVAGWQWWNMWVWGTVYINNDVMNYDTFRTRN